MCVSFDTDCRMKVVVIENLGPVLQGYWLSWYQPWTKWTNVEDELKSTMNIGYFPKKTRDGSKTLYSCWPLQHFLLKCKHKYTNPATGILDFCKQKLWPLRCSQLTKQPEYSYDDAIPDPVMMTHYYAISMSHDAVLDPVMMTQS